MLLPKQQSQRPKKAKSHHENHQVSKSLQLLNLHLSSFEKKIVHITRYVPLYVVACNRVVTLIQDSLQFWFLFNITKFAGRSKSPKSRASSQERSSSANSNMFVRANSLKAWKEEQDRAKAEEEEKERAQSAKRARSAQKRVYFCLPLTIF